MKKIFFESWESIARTLLITSLSYVIMVILLRISGKRTLAKMYAFDFVVTIALGSSLATVALNKSVTLADGIAALGVFILAQFLLTWLSVRIPRMKTLITSVPTLLFYRGDFLWEAMIRERISEEEIFKTSRMAGLSILDDVEMIILESTEDILIVKKNEFGIKNTVNHLEKKMEEDLNFY